MNTIAAMVLTLAITAPAMLLLVAAILEQWTRGQL